MDTTLIAAIITAVATIAAAIITVYLKARQQPSSDNTPPETAQNQQAVTEETTDQEELRAEQGSEMVTTDNLSIRVPYTSYSYPLDFTVPEDQGGLAQGQPMGGFGGDPSKSSDEHKAASRIVGKAPVVLIHGDPGSAAFDGGNMLGLKQMLNEVGYPDELIWAPSYLEIWAPSYFGTGILDLENPHTSHVNEVREFLDNVCKYMDVEVVDIIAHSLGCTLAYAILRGLKGQTTPIEFNQPKKWHRVGAFVALAGAFHGLGSSASGEWQTGGEFMRKLLAEYLGGGGETPFQEGQPETPPPGSHNITYFCGIAEDDLFDHQNPGTGKLQGAINRVYRYDLDDRRRRHQEIKEDLAVFHDFLPFLNSVAPAP